MGSFNNGVFIPHRDSAMTEENTSSTPTPTPTPKPKERSATPEWYNDPSSMNQLNPTGIRAGASYPAAQAPNSKLSRGRDSIDQADDKADHPRKRRRLLSTGWIKAKAERLFPDSVYMAPPRRLPLSRSRTQSEATLGQYPLEVEVDSAMSLTDLWDLMGYSYTRIPVQPARLRTVSSPPVLPDQVPARMHWWTPSGYQVRPPTWRQTEGSETGSQQDDMSEAVSPVTQVPASPRLEGESKDEDMSEQMDILMI